MGLILVFGILLVVGVIVIARDGDFYSLGVTLTVVFGTALAIALVAMIVIQADQPRMIAAYEQDKAYIEASMTNDSLTDTERSKVMELMLQDNLIITGNKVYRDNFFLGWFNQYQVGDLKLFDFTEVQKAKLQVDLVRDK